MFVSELDTFVEKFKTLWKKGSEAHLDIDEKAGQAWVGLRLRLGHDPGPPHHPYPPFQARSKNNSPSRQRRRERRAAERKQLAEQAQDAGNHVTEVVVEESAADENVEAEIASIVDTDKKKHTEKVEESAMIVETRETVNDEFCSDESLNNDRNEEIIVEEIMATPTKETTRKKENLESVLEYELKIVGIDALKITRRNMKDSNCFLVKIRPTSLSELKGLSFENWSLKPMQR